jgi:hypothetical protein
MYHSFSTAIGENINIIDDEYEEFKIFQNDFLNESKYRFSCLNFA